MGSKYSVLAWIEANTSPTTGLSTGWHPLSEHDWFIAAMLAAIKARLRYGYVQLYVGR